MEARLPYANFNRLWPLQLTSDADNCCAVSVMFGSSVDINNLSFQELKKKKA